MSVVNFYKICNICNGRGSISNNSCISNGFFFEPYTSVRVCNNCHGRGQVVDYYTYSCTICKGSGKNNDNICKYCHGKGRIKQKGWN